MFHWMFSTVQMIFCSGPFSAKEGRSPWLCVSTHLLKSHLLDSFLGSSLTVCRQMIVFRKIVKWFFCTKYNNIFGCIQTSQVFSYHILVLCHQDIFECSSYYTVDCVKPIYMPLKQMFFLTRLFLLDFTIMAGDTVIVTDSKLFVLCSKIFPFRWMDR